MFIIIVYFLFIKVFHYFLIFFSNFYRFFINFLNILFLFFFIIPLDIHNHLLLFFYWFRIELQIRCGAHCLQFQLCDDSGGCESHKRHVHSLVPRRLALGHTGNDQTGRASAGWLPFIRAQNCFALV